MNFSKLVPNIFYSDIHDGIHLFRDCLEFEIAYDDTQAKTPFCVLAKGDLRINLFENKELAEEHHPEFRLVTDNIQEVYDKISSTHPEILHPNLSQVTKRPWGAKEFAIMDCQLGVVIQEWPKNH